MEKKYLRNDIVFLRIVAVFMVVSIHICALFLNTNIIRDTTFIIANLIDSTSRIAVPLFVLISGALMLKPQKNISIFDFYKKRLFRICLPLIFWCSLFLFFRMSLEFYKTESVNTYSLFLDLYKGIPFYHLWYIFMYIGLVLLTPFISLILNTFTLKSSIILGSSILFCSILFLLEGNTYDNSFFLIKTVDFIGYYILGYCLSYLNIGKRWRLILVITFIISLIATFYGYYFSSYFYRYTSINVALMSICFFLYNINTSKYIRNEFQILSKYSMGIFYVHPIFVKGIEYLCMNYIKNTPILLPVAIILVLFLSLFTCILIDKLFGLKKIIQ